MADVGRICVKLRGSDAGRRGVVVSSAGDQLLLTGPRALTGVRRRAIARWHVEMTDRRVAVAPDASDDEVLAALEREGLVPFICERVLRPLAPNSAARLWTQARQQCPLDSDAEALAKELGLDPRELLKNRPVDAAPGTPSVSDSIRALSAARRSR